MKNTKVLLLVLVIISFANITMARPAYELVVLNKPENLYAYPNSINNHRQILGTTNPPQGLNQIILWNQGEMTFPGEIEGAINTTYFPCKINDDAKFAGNYISNDGYTRGFLYSPEQGYSILDVEWVNDMNQQSNYLFRHDLCSYLADENGSRMVPINGLALNNFKIVAGEYQDTACYWDSEQGIQMIGHFDGDINSWATDINDAGQVVGISEDASGAYHAFYYDSQVGMVNIIDRPDELYVRAYAINNAGKVIGTTYERPFLYDEKEVYYLDELVDFPDNWQRIFASDINDHGDIVGSYIVDNTYYAFLLTPVPEPLSLSLLALGGVALARRRKK